MIQVFFRPVGRSVPRSLSHHHTGLIYETTTDYKLDSDVGGLRAAQNGIIQIIWLVSNLAPIDEMLELFFDLTFLILHL